MMTTTMLMMYRCDKCLNV